MFNYLKVFVIIIILSSCYHLKNVAIAAEVNTYYVYDFKTSATNVDANFAFLVQEDLKSRIRQETRLKYDDKAPDIEIKANLKQYTINISDLSANNVAKENSVVAVFSVKYIDNTNVENNWEKDFREETQYSTDIDYFDAETQIQQTLKDQFSATIFNALFNNW